MRHSEDGVDFNIFILSLSFSHYLLALSLLPLARKYTPDTRYQLNALSSSLCQKFNNSTQSFVCTKKFRHASFDALLSIPDLIKNTIICIFNIDILSFDPAHVINIANLFRNESMNDGNGVPRTIIPRRMEQKKKRKKRKRKKCRLYPRK